MKEELMKRIDDLIWDEKVSNDEKVQCIKALMYQYEQLSDARSEAIYRAYEENMAYESK